MPPSGRALEELYLNLNILLVLLCHRVMSWSSVNPAWVGCVSELVPWAQEVRLISQHREFCGPRMVFFALITRVYAVVSSVIISWFFFFIFFSNNNNKKVNSDYTRGGRINFNCVACAIISYNSSCALYIYIYMWWFKALPVPGTWMTTQAC